MPVSIIAPSLAVGFAVRAGGNFTAAARGEWGMPWGARITSWVAFGIVAGLLGLAGSLFTVAGFAAFVVLDGAAGFVRRETEAKERPKRDWRPFWIGTAIVLYLALTAVFYLFVGRFFVYGVLATWCILAFGFALLLRLSMVGPKAPETWLAAPKDHRVHERREEKVADPQRKRAEAVLLAFRARGDATPFLEFVREAARNADLKEEDIQALENRMFASFARVGTRRDEDVIAALDEVERILALKARVLDVPVTQSPPPRGRGTKENPS